MIARLGSLGVMSVARVLRPIMRVNHLINHVSTLVTSGNDDADRLAASIILDGILSADAPVGRLWLLEPLVLHVIELVRKLKEELETIA